MKLIPRKKYITEIFLEIILIFIFAVCLLLPAIRKTAAKCSHNSLVSNSRLDFKIPSPSKEQIKFIEKMSSVDAVFPFFDTFAAVQVDSKVLKDTFVLIVPSQCKNDFPLVNNKLLIKGELTSGDEMLFADYSFFKKNEVDIDSPVKISLGTTNKEFKLSGVINNFGDLLSSSETQKNAVLLFLDEKDLDSYVGKSISYSGAYIRCNDAKSFKQYLESYKTYGRMKTRDAFDSEQKYKEYVDYFNKGNYGAEILNLELRNKLDMSDISIRLAFIFAIVSFVVILIFGILVITDKALIHNSQSLIQNGEDFSVVKNSVKILLSILLWTIIFEICILFYVFVLHLYDYCSIASLVPIAAIAIFLPLLLGIFSTLILSAIVEKRAKSSFEGISKK